MSFFLAATIGTWLDQTFAGFDMAVFQFFGNLQNEILNVISMIFTTMGSEIYIALFGLFGLVLIIFRRTRKYGMAIVLSIIIGTLLTNIICKPIVQRIRPYKTLQQIAEYLGWYKFAGMLVESDYSFPSGHTSGAAEIGMALCLCFASDRKWKYFWIPPLVAILVACSRIYLMVHYVTDVIAGFIIGIIAGIVGFIIAKLLTDLINRHADKKAAQTAVGPVKQKKEMFTSGQLTVTCIIVWLLIFTIAFIPVITGAN